MQSILLRQTVKNWGWWLITGDVGLILAKIAQNQMKTTESMQNAPPGLPTFALLFGAIQDVLAALAFANLEKK